MLLYDFYRLSQIIHLNNNKKTLGTDEAMLFSEKSQKCFVSMTSLFRKSKVKNMCCEKFKRV